MKYDEDYNPIWNKDGTKTHIETTVRSKDNTVDNSHNNSINDNGDDINQVSAYDTSGFSNDSKTSTHNNRNENGNNNTRGNEKENIKLTIEDIEKEILVLQLLPTCLIKKLIYKVDSMYMKLSLECFLMNFVYT